LASTLEVESLSTFSSSALKDDDDDDDHEALGSGSASSAAHYGQHLANRKPGKRGGGKAKGASAEFERMGVKTGPRVAKAVDMIDAWTLVTGRFLRSYPLLRIAFVAYLALIHLWAIVILAVHTHSLDLE
jgi:hypothetical protein